MSERPADRELTGGVPPAVPSLVLVSPPPLRIFCVRCAADLTPLPPVAKFCNRCGSSLPEHFHRQPLAQAAVPEVAVPVPVIPLRPSDILLAYARALVNLGWRYESAVGSRRNLEEAARCYWKAARLDHAAAQISVEAVPPPLASVHPPSLS
jgi:hypothetical protein